MKVIDLLEMFPLERQKQEMSETQDRFIEEATRPVEANFELRLAAKDWLGNQISNASEEDMASAVRRWEQVDAKKKRFTWRQIVIVLALLLTPFLFFPSKSAWKQGEIFRGLGMMSGPTPSYQHEVFRKLDEHGRLLIGDPAMSGVQQAEELLKSDPSNPAYFAEYAGAHWNAHKRLPKDYEATVARLDPDNAWFDFFAAATEANGAVEKITKVKRKGDPPEWKILDEIKFRNCLKLLEGASGKFRCDSYSELMLRKRTEILPQGTPAEQLASVTILATRGTSYFSLMKLPNVIAARARELGDAGDVEGFKDFRGRYIEWSELLLRDDPASLINVMINRFVVSGAVKNFSDIEAKLGSDQEAVSITRWKDSFDRFEAERKIRQTKSSPMGDLILQEGSLLTSIGLPTLSSHLENPPLVTREDLAPMRYSEHSMISVASVVVLWLAFLLVMLAVFLYRYRAPMMVRKLADRAVALLRPTDWSWILGAGVMVPCFTVMMLAAFTPLGGRDMSMKWGFERSLFFMPTGQFALLLVLTFVLVILIARWRFRRRAAMLVSRQKDFFGWIAVLLLLVAIPGAMHLPTYLSKYGFLAWVALPEIWLIVVAVRALFGRKERSLGRVAMSQVLLVSLAVGVLCISPMIVWFTHATQSWFEKDRFMKLTPDAPGMTPYEYKVAQAFHEETLRMVESK